MRVDEQLIRHVAKLARLELTDEEVAKFIPQFREILDAFSKIKDVSTDTVNPSIQPVEMMNNMRADEPKKPFKQKEALSNTKHQKDGYFLGPKAI